ncbi:MAG TPA: inorganic diphosphatase [Terriglobales bacterium]
MREISHYFGVYKDLEGKRTQMIGWQDAAAARNTIVESHVTFKKAIAGIEYVKKRNHR